jgi:hypothetical protein
MKLIEENVSEIKCLDFAKLVEVGRQKLERVGGEVEFFEIGEFLELVDDGC